MDVSPFMLLSQEFEGLGLGKTAATLGVVLQDEIRKGLADDHAYLNRLARVGASVTTSAFEDSDIRRPLKNQVPGHRIRNDLLQVTQGDVVIEGDEGLGQFCCEHLSVVMVCQALLPVGIGNLWEDACDEIVDILVCPAAIDITVQTTPV
jgi:hypothetical protein